MSHHHKFDKNEYLNVNHIVDYSPWPILTAVTICQLLLSLLHYMEFMQTWPLIWSVIQFGFFFWQWMYNIIIEATFEGMHTKIIQKNILTGMVLFIISEVMFFFSFFWALFSFSLSPSVFIGCVWPPVGIQIVSPYGLPLLNTVLLLSSGVSITSAHRLLLAGKKDHFNVMLFITILYGFLFLCVQYYEYNHAQFTISDSVYGSIFYVLTGFHGSHVLVGLIFLCVCMYNSLQDHYTVEHHVSFECATWYWHFVDVVWLFLYLFLYVWSAIQ